MAVYVIADLHLSTGKDTNKSMEVFGNRWKDYVEKIRKNWQAVVEDDDTVIIPGDISWALSLEEAKDDLAFVNSLPGKKILMKGNHDFWWTSQKKMAAFCEANGFSTLAFLHHDAMVVENYIVMGTRGWFYDDKKEGASESDIARLIAREAIRLDISIKAAKKLQVAHPDKEMLTFFHFPPLWGGQVCEPFITPLKEAGIERCYFGHIHGAYACPAYNDYEGIRFTLIAADYLSFTPQHIPVTGKC